MDGSNLYYILRDLYGKDRSLLKFNFEKFVKFLANERKLIRTYYYTAPLDQEKDPDKYAKQQQMFETLKKIQDFQLVLCRMQKEHKNGKIVYTVKEDDIHLAVDMLTLAYNDAYDSAVLVSSDADFIPVIKAIKVIGKKAENIGFENKFSWHLKQECDRFRQLSKRDLDQCFDK